MTSTANDQRSTSRRSRSTQRAGWETGDYPRVGNTLQIMAEQLVEAADVRAGAAGARRRLRPGQRGDRRGPAVRRGDRRRLRHQPAGAGPRAGRGRAPGRHVHRGRRRASCRSRTASFDLTREHGRRHVRAGPPAGRRRAGPGDRARRQDRAGQLDAGRHGRPAVQDRRQAGRRRRPASGRRRCGARPEHLAELFGDRVEWIAPDRARLRVPLPLAGALLASGSASSTGRSPGSPARCPARTWTGSPTTSPTSPGSSTAPTTARVAGTRRVPRGGRRPARIIAVGTARMIAHEGVTAMLTIRLLGPPAIERDGRPVRPPRGPQGVGAARLPAAGRAAARPPAPGRAAVRRRRRPAGRAALDARRAAPRARRRRRCSPATRSSSTLGRRRRRRRPAARRRARPTPAPLLGRRRRAARGRAAGVLPGVRVVAAGGAAPGLGRRRGAAAAGGGRAARGRPAAATRSRTRRARWPATRSRRATTSCWSAASRWPATGRRRCGRSPSARTSCGASSASRRRPALREAATVGPGSAMVAAAAAAGRPR